MTDITGLTGAFASLTGLSATLWGYILAGVFTVALIIILNWAIANRGGDSMITITAAVVGLGLSTLFGWLDIWVPIFILIVLVIVYYGPLRDSLGGGV